MVETEDLTRWCEKPESSQDVFAAPVWTHQLEFTRLRGRESKRRQWGEQEKSNPEAPEADIAAPGLETNHASRGCVTSVAPRERKTADL